MLEYEFMQNAFLIAILASIACGIVGTLVVVKRVVFISGGIAHASFGGIGIGYLLGVSPVLTLIPFSLLAAIAIGYLSKKTKISEDASIGIFWSLGMALGIFFIDISSKPTPDLLSYLFGNILMVPKSDVLLILVLDIIILLTVVGLYKYFLAISFDEEFTKAQGIRTFAFYLITLCLISLTVVTLIRVVGIILVISLLTIPAIISRLFVVQLKSIMVLASIISIAVMGSGLMISYYFDLVSGPTIIILSMFFYLCSHLITGLRKKR
ncbi:metal ABC transporter permease [Candidatus Margulisiibacteriota bacterium]